MKIEWIRTDASETENEMWTTIIGGYQIRIYRVLDTDDEDIAEAVYCWSTTRTGKWGAPQQEKALDDSMNAAIHEVRSWSIDGPTIF